MILIDPPVWRARGRTWSHLASDTSYAELHQFAERAGLHPFSYDGDHYDVPQDRYDDVVRAGAVECSAREILARVQSAGLRFRKRRGERPLAALPDGLPYLTSAHRLDLVASRHEPPDGTTIAVVTFVTDPRGRVLLVRSRRRDAWEGPGGWREPGETAREAAARELAEEADVLVSPTALVPVAYERVILHEPAAARGPMTGAGAGRWGPVNHIAVYRASADTVAPARGTGPEGQPLGWFEDEELPARCGTQPWWPILDRLFRADASQSRRARSVR